MYKTIGPRPPLFSNLLSSFTLCTLVGCLALLSLTSFAMNSHTTNANEKLQSTKIPPPAGRITFSSSPTHRQILTKTNFFELKKRWERDLENKISSLVSKVIGEGQSVIQANVTLNELESFDEDIETDTSFLKKVNVTVLLNKLMYTAKDKKKEWKPRSQKELTQLESLIKNTIGFTASRGDSVKIENIRFLHPPQQKDKFLYGQKKSLLFKWSLLVLGLLLLFSTIIRPLLIWLTPSPPPQPIENITAGGLIGNTIGNTKRDIPTNPSLPSQEFKEKKEAHKIDDFKPISTEDSVMSTETTSHMTNEKSAHKREPLRPSKGHSLEILKKVDTSNLARFLVHEHPQTISVVLAHLDAEKKGEVLKKLPEPLQFETLLRLSQLKHVSPDLVSELEKVLQQELPPEEPLEAMKYGGTQSIADMLNTMDKDMEISILSQIEERDSLLASEIQKLMFLFEDLVKVDNRGIQTLLREIPNHQLLLALKTASDEVKEKIFQNLSQRAARLLKEDLEDMGPSRLSDVEAAQEEIVHIAKKLEQANQLFIIREGTKNRAV